MLPSPRPAAKPAARPRDRLVVTMNRNAGPGDRIAASRTRLNVIIDAESSMRDNRSDKGFETGTGYDTGIKKGQVRLQAVMIFDKPVNCPPPASDKIFTHQVDSPGIQKKSSHTNAAMP